ncbi:hypothetical protein GCM10010129_40970 [Streptomyces fumigatiscleroticus]|nr:hypothetical protein GCM10010129_40970 [Streptomyces fumigatiscleroticus]
MDTQRDSVSRLADALLDPPARPDLVGKIGFEVEYRHPVKGPEDVDLIKKTLATHTSGARIVGDEENFFRGIDGRLYTVEHTPEDLEGSYEELFILEFVSPPMAALREDTAAPSQESQLALLRQFRQRLRAVDTLDAAVSLSTLLSREHGWDITSWGEDVYVYPAPQGTGDFGYAQFTVGVPLGGLQAMLELAEERLEVSDVRPIMTSGRAYGMSVAAHYASIVTRRQVRPEDVPFLTDLIHLDELSGYAWLVFLHVVARPLWVLHLGGEVGLGKNLVPTLLRHPFHTVRDALSPAIRHHLSTHVDVLHRLFEAEFQKLLDYYARRQHTSPHDARTALTIGGSHDTPRDYLHYALTGSSPNGGWISQLAALGAEDYLRLDSTRGLSGMELVLIEFRSYAIDFDLRDPLGREFDMSDQAISVTARQLTQAVGHAHAQATRFTQYSGISHATANDILADPLVTTLQYFFTQAGDVRIPASDGIRLPALTAAERSFLAAAIARRHTGTPLPHDFLSRIAVVEQRVDTAFERFEVPRRIVPALELARQVTQDVRQSVVETLRQEQAQAVTQPHVPGQSYGGTPGTAGSRRSARPWEWAGPVADVPPSVVLSLDENRPVIPNETDGTGTAPSIIHPLPAAGDAETPTESHPAVSYGEVDTDRWIPFGGDSDTFSFQQRLDGGFVVSLSGERTRVAYSWSWHRNTLGGEQLRLTKRVHLQAVNASGTEIENLKSGMQRVLSSRINEPGHRVPVPGISASPGPVLQVEVHFVDQAENAHDVIQVRAGRPSTAREMVQNVWFASIEPEAYVHEILHGLGIWDDQAPPHALLTPGGRNEQEVGEDEASFMGPFSDENLRKKLVLTPDHLRQIGAVFAPYAQVPAPVAGTTPSVEAVDGAAEFEPAGGALSAHLPGDTHHRPGAEPLVPAEEPAPSVPAMPEPPAVLEEPASPPGHAVDVAPPVAIPVSVPAARAARGTEEEARDGLVSFLDEPRTVILSGQGPDTAPSEEGSAVSGEATSMAVGTVREPVGAVASQDGTGSMAVSEEPAVDGSVPSPSRTQSAGDAVGAFDGYSLSPDLRSAGTTTHDGVQKPGPADPGAEASAQQHVESSSSTRADQGTQLPGLAEARARLAGLDERKRNELLGDAGRIMANRHKAPPIDREGVAPGSPEEAYLALHHGIMTLIADTLLREPLGDSPLEEHPAWLLSERLRQEYGTHATSGGVGGMRPFMSQGTGGQHQGSSTSGSPSGHTTTGGASSRPHVPTTGMPGPSRLPYGQPSNASHYPTVHQGVANHGLSAYGPHIAATFSGTNRVAAFRQISPAVSRYASRTEESDENIESEHFDFLTAYPRTPEGELSSAATAHYTAQASRYFRQMYADVLKHAGVSLENLTSAQLRQVVAPYLVDYPELSTYLHATQQNPNARADINSRIRSDKMQHEGVELTIYYMMDDALAQERVGVLRRGITILREAGYTLPSTLEVLLPKYHRILRVALGPDGFLQIVPEDVTSDIHSSTLAVFQAPNLMVITAAATVTFPVDYRTAEGDGVDDMLEEAAVGTILHELLHWLNFSHSPARFVDLKLSTFRQSSQQLASLVSPYATTSPAEYVAEYGLTKLLGLAFARQQELDTLYEAFGGPLPRRPGRVSAPRPTESQMAWLQQYVAAYLLGTGLNIEPNRQLVENAHNSLAPFDKWRRLTDRVAPLAAVISRMVRNRPSQHTAGGWGEPVPGVDSALRTGDGRGFGASVDLTQAEQDSPALRGARALVRVPEDVERPVASRREASRLLALLLHEETVRERLRDAGARVIVLPSGRNLPELLDSPQFARAAGGGGETERWLSEEQRPSAEVRGWTFASRPVAVVSEENLLGLDAAVGRVHREGYSSALHEMAHLVHRHGLGEEQRALIQSHYERQIAAGEAGQWVDGPLTSAAREGERSGSYASTSAEENFAQTVVAYFGANHGLDPRTGGARNNGAEWIKEQLPDLYRLLEELFGPPPAEPLVANALSVSDRDDLVWEALADHTTLTESPPQPAASAAGPDPTTAGDAAPGQATDSSHAQPVAGTFAADAIAAPTPVADTPPAAPAPVSEQPWRPGPGVQPGVSLPVRVNRYKQYFDAAELAGLDTKDLVAAASDPARGPRHHTAIQKAVADADEKIRKHIKALSPKVTMANADFLLTLPSDAHLGVWLSFAQGLANSLEHRIIAILPGRTKTGEQVTLDICQQTGSPTR